MENTNKSSVYTALYSSQRERAEQRPGVVDNRTTLRILTIRLLYVLLGVMLPHIGFLVFMILKDYRKQDSRYLLVALIIGALYFVLSLMGSMIFFNPNW